MKRVLFFASLMLALGLLATGCDNRTSENPMTITCDVPTTSQTSPLELTVKIQSDYTVKAVVWKQGSVKADFEKSGFEKATAGFAPAIPTSDNKEWKFTVTENDTYSIAAQNEAGQCEYEEVEVKCITTSGSNTGGNGGSGTGGNSGTGGGGGTTTTKTLTSISVTPTKISYTKGESFDKSHITVTATYSDSTSSTITNYSVDVTTFDTTGTITVTVTYTEDSVTKTALYDVKVLFVKVAKGDYDLNESGTYKVTLTRDFEICIHEVTQTEYEAAMGTNPSQFKNNPRSGEKQENRPVEKVTWYDAIAYCNKRTETEGIKRGSTSAIDYVYFSDDTYTTAYNATDASSKKEVFMRVDTNDKIDATGYRLPTDAEWEIAARGGLTGDVWAGTNTESDLGTYAWYGESYSDGHHEVMKKEPNDYGIYDMSGNVWEWCWDWYDDTSGAYTGDATDPCGAGSGPDRVIRGGSWFSTATHCRAAFRDCDGPVNADVDLGFRVVRSNY